MSKKKRKTEGRAKREKGTSRRPKQLEVGDAVLVLTNTRDEQGVMQWKGPNRVMGVVRRNQYQVKVNKKIRTYHISWLKKYIHDSEKHMSRDGTVRLFIGETERGRTKTEVSI